ncbi:hypothetical protein ACFPAF_07740 [Hymenobacter endophyticus]|uniref:Uncharacterized protein n=1 Tax=Hymenobacter endophyticus TaxID=3076335 RepID=A0ABU3TFW8_9BACT|nr:hypothetical protein [Hymenobacter endophyticus]MDU0370277.1 hypothetical protein [Hymenobacter endophyticus]
MNNLDSFSTIIYKKLQSSFADQDCAYEIDKEQLVVDFPCPDMAEMGGMIVQTTSDHHIWLRIHPGCSAYLIDGLEELISVMQEVMADRVCWVIGFAGDEWIETTLIRNKDDLELEQGAEYHLYSWSGNLDEVLKA